jgi:hypothetical protein
VLRFSFSHVARPAKFLRVSVFFLLVPHRLTDLSVAGVAMDPSQGNTSSLVMTNHLYRLICSLLSQIESSFVCASSSTQDDILTKLRANKKTKVPAIIQAYFQPYIVI